MRKAWVTFGLFVAILGPGCAILPTCHPVEVSAGIFEGCKPRDQADFDSLRQQGVRTVLSLETLPFNIWPERKRARQNGINYTNVSILATPLPPRERRVKQALQTLADQSLYPIFIHCFLGEDRAVFIVGLYRIYYLKWTPEAAWDEMLREGFHVRESLRGFTTYFWKHTEVPDWVRPPPPSPTKPP